MASSRPPADTAVQRARSPYRRHALAALALCALTLLAYSNSFAGGLVLDNKVLLLDPRIREATPQNIALIFQHSYSMADWRSGSVSSAHDAFLSVQLRNSRRCRPAFRISRVKSSAASGQRFACLCAGASLGAPLLAFRFHRCAMGRAPGCHRIRDEYCWPSRSVGRHGRALRILDVLAEQRSQRMGSRDVARGAGCRHDHRCFL